MTKKTVALLILSLFAWSCGSETVSNVKNSNANTTASPDAARDTITIAERPQKVKDQMAARGQQDQATPTLTVVSPADGLQINSSTVKVKLNLSGDLKGYKPHMDPETKLGNHIHVILDNQPYEAYYNLDQEFELRNVTDGGHTLRVFPSRSWPASYKNSGAFQLIKATVKDAGGDPPRPPTTHSANTLAKSHTASKPTALGNDVPSSSAGADEPTKPQLPLPGTKGEDKGIDAASIMIEFWPAN